jgi:predicted SAM-dependent methyltransferase
MRPFLVDATKISVYQLFKRWQHYNTTRKANYLINKYCKNHTQRKLQIGAGGSIQQAWLNTDIEMVHPELIFMDATVDFPIPSNSFQYVYSEHCFEHLDITGQLNMVAEAFRILCKGGVLRIATPDIDKILALRSREDNFTKEYIEWSAAAYFPDLINKVGDAAVSDIFVVNNFFYNWGHRFLHNPTTLKAILHKAGFKIVYQAEIYDSKHPELCNLEMHGNVIPRNYNEYETMVFEAQK